jgi:hypothetical protein
MMKNPFVIEQADLLADLLLQQEMNDSQRVTFAYKLALARSATKAEVARTMAYVDDAKGAGNDAYAWSGFCQALFGSAEFRFLE